MGGSNSKEISKQDWDNYMLYTGPESLLKNYTREQYNKLSWQVNSYEHNASRNDLYNEHSKRQDELRPLEDEINKIKKKISGGQKIAEGGKPKRKSAPKKKATKKKTAPKKKATKKK